MEKSLYCNAEEQSSPVTSQTIGVIPDWLNGDLYRNGPGLFRLGDSELDHWFDGMALLHHFHIQKGQVVYRSKFIQSDSYKRNRKANCFVRSEFGTFAYPDPCKNIFQRFFAWFVPQGITDNTLVTVTPLGDSLIVASEVSVIHQIDPDTLDTKKQITLPNLMPVNMASAHYHRDEDGTLHNIGQFIEGRPKFSIFKVPPPLKDKAVYEDTEVVGSIYCRWPFHLGYMHSFGMSENYYVFVEQPLCLNVKSFMLSKFSRKTYEQCLEWWGQSKCIFRIMDKKTGETVNRGVLYMADPFFMFHHINTYEENGYLIVDVAAYDDAEIIKSHYLANLKSETIQPFPPNSARRFVLPLNAAKEDDVGKSYVDPAKYSATASKQDEKRIICKPEILAECEGCDLPAINYEEYNGKKYRYLYGVSGKYAQKLVKIDIEKKASFEWMEDDAFVSEPVYVRNPDGTLEDDGVILAVVYKKTGGKHVTFLLVLDARTMTELGRAEFDLQLPRDLHGVFLPQKIAK